MSAQCDGPLAGVRVVDFTRVLAGPYATMLLADMGADVVKIERSGTGDDTRGWGPHWADDLSSYYQSVNRNKTSMACDLKSPTDQRAVRALCDRADVVVENFRTGTMDGFGLGPRDMLGARPDLVYCSLTGFGSGPGAALSGYDSIVQAISGLMSVTGPRDDEPAKVGLAVVDIIAGLHVVVGVLAALRHRDHTGVGQHVEVNLLSSALSAMTYHATAVANGGEVPARLGNRHPSIAPSDVLPTIDAAVMLAVGNDGQFRSLCRLLDRAHLADDVRFATNAARLRHADELRSLLGTAIAGWRVADLVAALDAAGVPSAPIHDTSTALDRAAQLGLDPVVPILRRDGSVSRQIRNPVGFSATPPTYRTAPQLWSDVPRVTHWKEEKASWLS